jgi:flavin reductase (DIM6/NTAB) family NADH-FMN oxidoreductase RutF
MPEQKSGCTISAAGAQWWNIKGNAMSLEGIDRVFARLDRELWLVTAAAGPRRGGLIATFVSQASIVRGMPRVLLGLARQHHTWELIEASGVFALHLLGEEHLDWVWRFGLSSGRESDKLEGLNWRPADTAVPLLTDARGWLSCKVEARLNSGDRTIYLAEVRDGDMTHRGLVLTLQRLLQLAPPEKLQHMKNDMVRDSHIDAAAIRDWRLRLAAERELS